MPGDAGLYRFPRVAAHEDLSRVRPRAIYTSRHGLAGDDIFALFEDARGDIWISRRAPTRVVLTRWDRASETFHRYFDRDGLPAFSRPVSFGEDRKGNVWVGFWGGGVARYRDGRFTLFTEADGVPPGAIGTIYGDASGRLWIGSGAGIARIDDVDAVRPHFERYTTARGLSSDDIHSITGDRRGRIYLGMFSGIDRLDPYTGQVRHYSLPDGLEDTEVNVAFCDRRGTLWFGTAEGLVSLIPAPDDPGTPPTVLIGALRVSGEAYPVSELGDTTIPAIELSSHQNQLQIDFFSISAVSPVRYQYKLEGADRNWSEPTEQRSVTFASLSPGRYEFLVRAISADGLPSTVPASVGVHISRPIWHRWWFLTGAALLLALAAYALHRVRLVRLLELERVRMRIATDLHDDIGSSLTQIAILSEVAERRMKRPDPDVAEPISRVSVISRELVDSISEIVWAINPRNDRLLDLTARMRRFAADMLKGRHIALPVGGQRTGRSDRRRPPSSGVPHLQGSRARRRASFRVQRDRNGDRASEPTSGPAGQRQRTRVRPAAVDSGPRPSQPGGARERSGRPSGGRFSRGPWNHSPPGRPSRSPCGGRPPSQLILSVLLVSAGGNRDIRTRTKSADHMPTRKSKSAESTAGAAPASALKIAIIEDQREIREGLATLIDSTEGYRCTGIFQSMEEALAQIGYNLPHVVLIDIGLPGMSGIEGTRLLKERYPHVLVLILTVYDDDDRIFGALCAGACGYLLKKTPSARLLESLREAMNGGAPMSPEVARRAIGLFQRFQPARHAEYHLTPHEVRLLKMLVQGHNYTSAAAELGVSFSTIAFHMQNIYQKLQVHSKSEAVAKALLDGIV